VRLWQQAALAAAFAFAAVALAHMHGASQRYQPMVEIAAPHGVTYLAVQEATAQWQACAAANRRFLEPVKTGCRDCEVLGARCERVAHEDGGAAEAKSMPAYLVTAPGLRLAIRGPEPSARQNCEFIAADMHKRGMRGTCSHQ
jgi:hypothetical protein